MSISIRFFASLADSLGAREATVEFRPGMAALDAWRAATARAELPGRVLVAINREYADPSAVLRDGDEVGFFPPVTGG
ncbi:MAG: MoaD/ThiS family protein [Gammaproteobacteria bacterium]